MTTYNRHSFMSGARESQSMQSSQVDKQLEVIDDCHNAFEDVSKSIQNMCDNLQKIAGQTAGGAVGAIFQRTTPNEKINNYLKRGEEVKGAITAVDALGALLKQEQSATVAPHQESSGPTGP